MKTLVIPAILLFVTLASGFSVIQPKGKVIRGERAKQVSHRFTTASRGPLMQDR